MAVKSRLGVKRSSWLHVLVEVAAFVLICQLAGVVGSIFTFQEIPTWYASLNKPFFNPPSWVFGPVWICLYTLMGIAAFLVWRNGVGEKKVLFALKLFFLQLALNALWPIIFFGMHSPLYAFVEIIVLWASIALTMNAFYKVDARAALLLAPYLAWTSFALALNFAIMLLN